jgi:hypothetical protein
MPPENDNLLAQCARRLGLTRSEVLAIARTGPKRYKVYEIDKRDGGKRIICQPSRELKALQYFFLKEVLSDAPIHEAATAYKKGSSIKDNASIHRRSRVCLKLDFEKFFPSISVLDWKRFAELNYPNWTVQEFNFSALVMFWGAGGHYPICLSIGAPTSPHLSNMLMYKFDEKMDQYAIDNGLVYSRYADDITISSNGFLNVDEAISFVKASVQDVDGPKLVLNEKKTYVATKARARRVTGLILTNDGGVSLGRDRKRLISAMVHQASIGQLLPENWGNLHGLLGFAADVEPMFVSKLKKKYGPAIMAELIEGKKLE